MTKEEEGRTISIPASLYRKLEERVKETEFDSVSSYVTHVLQELVSEEEPYSKEDEEKVKERLRALGYLG